jgi:Ser/Thr protein kinase RdoA (MazF antagonist)
MSTHRSGSGRSEALVLVLDRVLHFEDQDLVGRVGPHRTLFADALARAEKAVAELWANPPHAPHVLHGDFTPSNLVVSGEQLIPIDFQDLAIGFDLQDIAIAVTALLAMDETGSLARAFRQGYEGIRAWPDATTQQMDALFVARLLMMANLTLNVRKPGWEEHLDLLAGRTADLMRRL